MNRDGVLIIGLGVSGLAAARLARKKKMTVYVTEHRRHAANEERFRELEQLGIPFETENTQRFFPLCRQAVLSPGIPVSSPYIREVKEHMALIGELEFAFQNMAPGKTIIAVTGTNGKSTTVRLIQALLEGQGYTAASVGNIGLPLSDYFDGPEEFLVCEVSSYQLETIVTFKPQTAVITNITPDHLDRYENSFERYFKTKLRIAENMDSSGRLVLNGEDDRLKKAASDYAPRTFLFRLEGLKEQGTTVTKGYICYQDGSAQEKILRVKDLALPGRHNLENALAAVTAVMPFVRSQKRLSQSLADFPGIEHRLEQVCEINGILFVNDSKGTNVDSTRKALTAFPGKKVVLILGGDDAKKSDFSPLIPLIRKNCASVILLGETTPRIAPLLEKEKVAFVKTGSMKEAVDRGFKAARKGEIVLLSPAAASFDLYSDFEERGRDFKEKVFQLGECV